jgi:hypothetical protein
MLDFPYKKWNKLGFPAQGVLFRISQNTKRNEFRNFAKQTCRFGNFCFVAKQAVSRVSLFFKRNETAHFACFVTGTLTLRPWTSRPLVMRPPDDASLDDASPDDASLVRCVPCTMHLLYAYCIVRCGGRPVKKGFVLILRKNRPVLHTSEI